MGWGGQGGGRSVSLSHGLPDSPRELSSQTRLLTLFPEQLRILPEPATPGRAGEGPAHPHPTPPHSPPTRVSSPPFSPSREGQGSGWAVLSNYCKEKTNRNCLGLGIYSHQFFYFHSVSPYSPGWSPTALPASAPSPSDGIQGVHHLCLGVDAAIAVCGTCSPDLTSLLCLDLDGV